VAELHASGIDQGFLSSLGVRFLALLYRAIDESDSNVLLVARDGDRVVGFVAGGNGLRTVYGRMLRRAPALLIALLPSLLWPPRLFRVIETALYGARGGDDGTDLPRGELLSIAVDPAYRGKGYAEGLYVRLADWFAARNEPAFKIVVGEPLVAAHRFYRRMGAVPIGERQVHSGQRSTVYLHHCDVKSTSGSHNAD
jgi:GNAT superfamily N-acetyltransferase